MRAIRVNNLSTTAWNTKSNLYDTSVLFATTNSSLANVSNLLGTTNLSLLNVSTTLDETIINVHDTAITAGLALGEVNALALALGLSMALNTAREFIKTGEFSSDTGEFTESVSSTSVYCTCLLYTSDAADE